MQELTEAMQAHLANEVTTLATCWKITRTDGVVQCFTDHDENMRIGEELYRATTGMTASAVTSQSGMAVDNLEIEGLLADEAIGYQALLNGAYDGAELTLFMVDYTDPEAGTLHVKTGWLGEVTLRDGVFVVEVRGLSAALQQTIGEVYSATCRAKLGDGRCGKDLTALAVTGTVDGVESAFVFTDAARSEAGGYFAYGTVRFTSGANAGQQMEIRDFSNGRFTLFLPLPEPLQTGDAYKLVPGCDKQLDTCISRFANALNFRGEPHIPGVNRLFETSSTRNRE